MRYEQMALAHDMRAMGWPFEDIAEEFRARYNMGALEAMRAAHCWSQRDVADQWNVRWPDEPKSFKNISYWENWKSPTGYQPRLDVLDRLARIYQCRVVDLLSDCGDYRPTTTGEVPVAGPDPHVVAAGFGRADALEREVAARWPHAFDTLEGVRARPPGLWPHWCLIPTSLVAPVVGTPGGRPGPTAAVTALYAWRYTRALFVYHRQLASTVMRQPPDDLTEVDPGGVLCQWVVYVAGGHTDWPGAGLWAYLDYDYNSARPLLRLLVDLGDGGLDALVPIPVRLDLPLTEAIAADRGEELTPGTARLADVVDRLVGLVTYPTRDDSEVQVMAGSGSRTARPQRPRRPVTGKTLWALGFTDYPHGTPLTDGDEDHDKDEDDPGQGAEDDGPGPDDGRVDG
jgi:hypothetical protein